MGFGGVTLVLFVVVFLCALLVYFCAFLGVGRGRKKEKDKKEVGR